MLRQRQSIPRSTVNVTTAGQLTGALRSDRLYKIDGAIDLGSASITVPEGGLQIAGLGFDVSSLTTTGTLFVGPGTYSGNLQVGSVALTAASVFDLDNAGNGGAVECNDVNFVGCASIGELTAYRQGLWSGVGVIACTDGVTLSGAWSGGFATLDSIVIGGFTGTIFKAGPGLQINGSFRSNINALGIAIGGEFCDFSPSNILADGGFGMSDVRVNNGVTAFPNMPRGSTKARFRNCLGTDNTYPGGQWVITSATATVIASANTPVKLAGTVAYSDLQWFTGPVNNRFLYGSTQRIEAEIKSVLTLTGTNGDQANIIIRQWDDSASSFIDLSRSGASTMNASGRAEGVSALGYAVLDIGDYVEIWIENLTGGRNVTAEVGGLVGIGER